ncbi:hypothetical protein HYALB_00012803 [Hymenoscyphus albidus]|uniref:Uncharacterized protein n=1 Tax=Hymenoscyphus albidus TaxID=595503 RepID=A0A9N9LR36_9HELO|nr:hypothetical protein HYALB_00012803 [Hymenoscyphus albidus]
MKFTNIPTTLLLLASVLSANAKPIAKPNVAKPIPTVPNPNSTELNKPNSAPVPNFKREANYIESESLILNDPTAKEGRSVDTTAKRHDHSDEAPEFGTAPGSNNPTFTGGAVNVVGREAKEGRSVDTTAKRDEQLETRNEDEGLKAERPPPKILRSSSTDKRAQLTGEPANDNPIGFEGLKTRAANPQGVNPVDSKTTSHPFGFDKLLNELNSRQDNEDTETKRDLDLAARPKRSPPATRTLNTRKNKDIGNHILLPGLLPLPLPSGTPIHQEPHIVGDI